MVKPRITEVNQQINVLLHPQLQDLFAALFQLLVPYPEARIAVAQALGADRLFLEKSQIARRSQSACTGSPLHRREGSGSKPGQKWSKRVRNGGLLLLISHLATTILTPIRGAEKSRVRPGGILPEHSPRTKHGRNTDQEGRPNEPPQGSE